MVIDGFYRATYCLPHESHSIPGLDGLGNSMAVPRGHCPPLFPYFGIHKFHYYPTLEANEATRSDTIPDFAISSSRLDGASHYRLSFWLSPLAGHFLRPFTQVAR